MSVCIDKVIVQKECPDGMHQFAFAVSEYVCGWRFAHEFHVEVVECIRKLVANELSKVIDEE